MPPPVPGDAGDDAGLHAARDGPFDTLCTPALADGRQGWTVRQAETCEPADRGIGLRRARASPAPDDARQTPVDIGRTSATESMIGRPEPHAWSFATSSCRKP